MTAAFYDDPSFLYGNTGRKYDEVPSTYDANRLYWRFEVAWISPYNYWHETNGQTEVIYAESCYWSRGRDSFVNYNGEGFTRMEPGRIVIKLVNKDDRYDPDKATSPLYPHVAPGKLFRLGVRLASQTTYTWRFHGMITNIRPYRTEKGESMVDIEGTDGWGWMQDRVTWIPMLQSRDVSSDSLIPAILEDVNWPHMWNSTVTDDTVPLLWFWSGDSDVRTVLHDIAEAHAGALYIRGDGRLYYFPRLGIYSDAASYTQSDLLKDVPVNNPWENDWNYVVVSAKSLTDFAEYGTVWGDVVHPVTAWDITVTDEIEIASGETVTISGTFERPRGFTFEDESTFWFGHTGIGGTFPVLLSYDFMTGSGGTGSQKTGYIEILSFRENGESFEAILKNNHSATLYSTYISVLGYGKMYVPRKSLSFTEDRSGGKLIRPFVIKSPYVISGTNGLGTNITAAVLQDLASDYADIITSNTKVPTITLHAKPSTQFRDVFEKINIDIVKIGINDAFTVGKVEERWLFPTAQAVETKIRTDPYIGS